MGVIGIHHVQITVPPGSEGRAREFYCGVLGLPEVPKPASLQPRGGFWVRAGDRDLHVGIEEGVERTATKAHVAYEVADLNVWRQAIERAGLPVQASIPIEGYERFEARDPFGNRIEFIQRALVRHGGA